MPVLFATLGFTPEKVLPSIRARGGIERVLLYHDDHAKSKAAAADVQAYCKSQRITVRPREVDAFDVVACAKQIRRDLHEETLEDVVFNVTGGTAVLSTAATLLCILEGIRAVYVDEEKWEEHPLPLLTFGYREILPPEQLAVLRFIAGRKRCTQAEVAEGLDLARSTANYHVKNLKKRRLVESQPDSKDTRKERLTAVPASVLLLED